MASWSCIKYADVTRRGGDDTRQRPLRASSTKTSFPQSFLPSTQGRIQCTKKLPLRKLRTDFDSLESRERERETRWRMLSLSWMGHDSLWTSRPETQLRAGSCLLSVLLYLSCSCCCSRNVSSCSRWSSVVDLPLVSHRVSFLLR